MPSKHPPKQLLSALFNRFEANRNRHPNVAWEEFESLLLKDARIWQAVEAMENTGGEPDVILLEDNGSRMAVIDCVPESPAGRRSLCYDEAALQSRKTNKPTGSAHGMASGMGIELLNEQEYRTLQQFGNFDMKTSSWIATPDTVRQLGGALFCDRRYGQVFTYHNGAESYYASRGFRGILYLT